MLTYKGVINGRNYIVSWGTLGPRPALGTQPERASAKDASE